MTPSELAEIMAVLERLDALLDRALLLAHSRHPLLPDRHALLSSSSSSHRFLEWPEAGPMAGASRVDEPDAGNGLGPGFHSRSDGGPPAGGCRAWLWWRR